MNLFYTVLAKNGQGGFAKRWYWSSSQNGISYGGAWGQLFGGGNLGNDGKGSPCGVRAVRAF